MIRPAAVRRVDHAVLQPCWMPSARKASAGTVAFRFGGWFMWPESQAALSDTARGSARGRGADRWRADGRCGGRLGRRGAGLVADRGRPEVRQAFPIALHSAAQGQLRPTVTGALFQADVLRRLLKVLPFSSPKHESFFPLADLRPYPKLGRNLAPMGQHHDSRNSLP